MNQIKFVRKDQSLHIWNEQSLHIFEIKSGLK